jgi:hypothetical protein
MAGRATVHVPIDFAPMRRALRQAAEDSAKGFETMAQAVRNMGRAMARAHEVQVAGLEQRVYVRAAMDPAYAEPDALDSLVRLLLRKPSAVLGVGDSLFLHREDRYRLAAAAMRGWAEHRPHEWHHQQAMPWHRYMGGVRVQVN